jgi:hypothetical protein
MIILRFLETETVILELYVSTGSDAIRLGFAEISLKDLVN